MVVMGADYGVDLGFFGEGDQQKHERSFSGDNESRSRGIGADESSCDGGDLRRDKGFVRFIFDHKMDGFSLAFCTDNFGGGCFV